MLFDACSCVMRGVMICAVDQMLLGVQIKEGDVGGGCVQVWGGEETCI